jgi:hypothetical protein
MVSDLLKAFVLGPNILGLIAGLLVPAGLKWKPSAGLWLLAVMLNLLTVVRVHPVQQDHHPADFGLLLGHGRSRNRADNLAHRQQSILARRRTRP